MSVGVVALAVQVSETEPEGAQRPQPASASERIELSVAAALDRRTAR